MVSTLGSRYLEADRMSTVHSRSQSPRPPRPAVGKREALGAWILGLRCSAYRKFRIRGNREQNKYGGANSKKRLCPRMFVDAVIVLF